MRRLLLTILLFLYSVSVNSEIVFSYNYYENIENNVIKSNK
ncbi:MAG: hypothetical protein Q8K30_04570 [Candidatus Gracilibacteria bacterium]|nr:hypothetical protein [Candidatus Gracilibacteria bacterium]